MRISNWIALVLIALFSALVVSLWFLLGLNHSPAQYGLMLAIAWWFAIAFSVAAITLVERDRRKRVRTMYVGRKLMYNSEAGYVPYSNSEELVSEMSKTLRSLRYGFKPTDLPGVDEFPVQYIVRTESYAGVGDEWMGEVVCLQTSEQEPFDSKRRLEKILMQNMTNAA